MHAENKYQSNQSVLASLRSVVPHRQLTFTESLLIAELQASRLLESFGVSDAPVPSELVSELPRISVRYDRELPVSGSTYWDGACWVITLNLSEPWTRRRHTMAHEFKHIVDHGNLTNLYRGSAWQTPAQQAEHVADYFAGCLLVPKRLLKTAYFSGTQRPAELARRFHVSVPAMRVRLAQVGVDGGSRHQRRSGLSGPQQSDGPASTYYRIASRQELDR
jgi:Zn-dependent peptidase ImmA (M78 family)